MRSNPGGRNGGFSLEVDRSSLNAADDVRFKGTVADLISNLLIL